MAFSLTGCPAQTDPSENSDQKTEDYRQQRINMVENQIVSRGVEDSQVVQAMKKVKRHLFVPESYQDIAYSDRPLPIGEGQTISQPYIVALMTELLKVDSTKKILEIGTGSGYQAAVLAELCDSVYSIEIVESLAQRADSILNALNYENVVVRAGDGYKGWATYAPFDGIIVTCAPTHVPQPLKEQLAEGGRIVIPYGPRFDQELVILEKIRGKIRQKQIIPVRFVPMVKENGEKY